MATKRGGARNSWIWQYFIILPNSNSRIQCDMCNKNYSPLTEIGRLKDHLLKVHDIHNVQKLDWKDKTNLLWRYFIQDTAEVKCLICDERFLASHQYPLQEHLKNKHSRVIDLMYEEIRSTWVSQYFHFDREKCLTYCTNCNRIFKIFLGIHGLHSHLLQFHNINSEHSENYDVNNRNIMIQRSVAEENSAGPSSHHDNIQDAGNRRVQSGSITATTQTQMDSTISSEDINDIELALTEIWEKISSN